MRERVGQKDAQELDNTGEEKVGFSSKWMKGLSLLHTEDVLERADGAFNSGSFGIQFSPLVGAAQDTGIEAQIGIGIE